MYTLGQTCRVYSRVFFLCATVNDGNLQLSHSTLEGAYVIAGAIISETLRTVAES